MRMIADVKCYHCGHISGQVLGEKEDRLVLHEFRPRAGYKGTPPKAGDRVRCERCDGPVFLEELRAVPEEPALMALPKRPRRSRPEAA